jgi:hypothetical protein
MFARHAAMRRSVINSSEKPGYMSRALEDQGGDISAAAGTLGYRMGSTLYVCVP